MSLLITKDPLTRACFPLKKVNILPGLLRLDGLSLDDISMATPQRSLVKVENLNSYFGGPRQRVFKHPWACYEFSI
jgi:hypothetical protein